MNDTRPDEERDPEAQDDAEEEQPEVLTVEVDPEPEVSPAPGVVLKANGRPAGYGRPGK